MNTGIHLIAKERQKQIEVKGYDAAFVAAHPELYSDGQLAKAATLILTEGDGMYMPDNWPEEDTERLLQHEGIDALKVAAALIAAEIDRRIFIATHSQAVS